MSTYNSQPPLFNFLVGNSSFGNLPATGFKSGFTSVNEYSVINVSYKAPTTNTTLKIWQSPVSGDADQALLFEIKLATDTYFYKRFQIQGGFYAVEIVNDDAVEGTVFLSSCASSNTNFAASTFLNSKLTINEDTSLARIGNSYHQDLIRGIHESFQKINVQGLIATSSFGTSELTVGLPVNFTYNNANEETNMRVAGPNDNFPAGTGARQIKIDYILDTGLAGTSTYQLNTGIGGIALNLLCVNRATIVDTGTDYKNDGDITFENPTGTVINRVSAGKNVTQAAVYRVPSDKQLVLEEINICGSAPSGILRVIEIDGSNNIEYSLGDFLISTNYQQLTYNLDGLIPSGNIVKVNFIPTAGAPAGNVNINLNVNGILCPLISNFPQ